MKQENVDTVLKDLIVASSKVVKEILQLIREDGEDCIKQATLAKQERRKKLLQDSKSKMVRTQHFIAQLEAVVKKKQQYIDKTW